MGVKLTVIGAGPGGYAAAVRAAQLGAEVTLIEKEKAGGTCLHWGCIPSKIMKTAAEIIRKASRGVEFGLRPSEPPEPDMPGLMRRKERILEDQAKGLLHLFKKNGIRYLQGHAAVEAAGRIVVSTADAPPVEVEWERLILAVGSRPAPLPGAPFNGRTILSSDHALSLQHVPGSMLIVGGGVIGCEFASIFSSLGSTVTTVEAMDRLLPVAGVDEDCSKTLQREMKKRKIGVHLNAGVQEVSESDSGCRVTIGPSPFEQGAPQGRKTTRVDADCVLVCIGRRPNTEGLGLEKLGLKPGDRGWLSADLRMETGVPGVYAIGDILGPDRVMLAHVASTEGRIAAENALGGSLEMSYDAVPGAIFTSPEVGVVGRTEAEARAAGYDVLAETTLFRTLGKAHVIGEIGGQAKIVFEKTTGRILGVHLIGPGASDLISEATLAVRTGCTVEDVARTIHAHPTLSEIMLETALKAAGRPFHA